MGDTVGLEWNELSGSIPSELGQMNKMFSLALNNNKLNHEIPIELGFMTNLDRLHVNHNELTGQLPMEICNLKSIKAVRADCLEVTCPCCTKCFTSGES